MNKAEMRCAWLTDKYILCLLALFPLFTGFHGYANLTAAKFWLYTGVTALWALGIAACLCTGARLFTKKPGAFFYLTARSSSGISFPRRSARGGRKRSSARGGTTGFSRSFSMRSRRSA